MLAAQRVRNKRTEKTEREGERRNARNLSYKAFHITFNETVKFDTGILAKSFSLCQTVYLLHGNGFLARNTVAHVERFNSLATNWGYFSFILCRPPAFYLLERYFSYFFLSFFFMRIGVCRKEKRNIRSGKFDFNLTIFRCCCFILFLV